MGARRTYFVLADGRLAHEAESLAAVAAWLAPQLEAGAVAAGSVVVLRGERVPLEVRVRASVRRRPRRHRTDDPKAPFGYELDNVTPRAPFGWTGEGEARRPKRAPGRGRARVKVALAPQPALPAVGAEGAR